MLSAKSKSKNKVNMLICMDETKKAVNHPRKVCRKNTVHM